MCVTCMISENSKCVLIDKNKRMSLSAVSVGPDPAVFITINGIIQSRTMNAVLC